MFPLFEKFMRKKVIDKEETSQLNRVLSTVDLTLLGIGSTLGIGVYVLAGSVAKDSAGPAVVLSFLVAALASVLAGLCYAEFGSRVPKAGSAYVYSYVCIGELVSFIVGWNLIMEYVIGVASVAKGYSGYVDQIFNHEMSKAFTTYAPIHVSFLSDYFDAFAFSITLALTFLLAFGVKESSLFNNVFTFLNLGVVLFVVVVGSFYAKTSNWKLTKEEILNSTLALNITITAEKIGEGGFLPFGINGVMKGAATCFYGFVGFDCIATTGEEAKNPQKSIPIAIIFSLLFIFLSYFGISTVVTMMVPYYLQNSEAPLPQAFRSVNFTAGQWIVTLGALFGLSTSLLGAMFPMPRVIYAMASDGVLFHFLSTVNPRFQTPLVATIIAGVFGGIMAALFELSALIDMMSIGTLTAYTLVAVCVLCLRYRKDVDGADDDVANGDPIQDSKVTTFHYFGQVFNSQRSKMPTELSSSYTNLAVVLYCLFTLAFCAVAIFAENAIVAGSIWMICILAFFGLAIIFIVVSLSLQPVSRVKLSFKVPLVPLIPAMSILFNTYLIMKLSGITWIRFAVWMAIGFFFYGICLFNGTTDRAYAKSLANKSKRKYSKVSASGFQNKGLHFNNGNLDTAENGKQQAPEGESLAMRPFSQVKVTDEQKPIANSSQKCSHSSSPDVVDGKANKFTEVETETMEKSIDFDENEGESNDNYPVAEKAAVEAIESVISEVFEKGTTSLSTGK